MVQLELFLFGVVHEESCKKKVLFNGIFHHACVPCGQLCQACERSYHAPSFFKLVLSIGLSVCLRLVQVGIAKKPFPVLFISVFWVLLEGVEKTRQDWLEQICCCDQ